ncbi:unnamed protein product [Amoebophrya sp. A120]|nr:unnamed protein product [Amoebophrya sp. A120]|eukprot:GSA120T00016964001.1
MMPEPSGSSSSSSGPAPPVRPAGTSATSSHAPIMHNQKNILKSPHYQRNKQNASAQIAPSLAPAGVLDHQRTTTRPRQTTARGSSAGGSPVLDAVLSTTASTRPAAGAAKRSTPVISPPKSAMASSRQNKTTSTGRGQHNNTTSGGGPRIGPTTTTSASGSSHHRQSSALSEANRRVAFFQGKLVRLGKAFADMVRKADQETCRNAHLEAKVQFQAMQLEYLFEQRFGTSSGDDQGGGGSNKSDPMNSGQGQTKAVEELKDLMKNYMKQFQEAEDARLDACRQDAASAQRTFSQCWMDRVESSSPSKRARGGCASEMSHPFASLTVGEYLQPRWKRLSKPSAPGPLDQQLFHLAGRGGDFYGSSGMMQQGQGGSVPSSKVNLNSAAHHERPGGRSAKTAGSNTSTFIPARSGTTGALLPSRKLSVSAISEEDEMEMMQEANPGSSSSSSCAFRDASPPKDKAGGVLKAKPADATAMKTEPSNSSSSAPAAPPYPGSGGSARTTEEAKPAREVVDPGSVDSRLFVSNEKRPGTAGDLRNSANSSPVSAIKRMDLRDADEIITGLSPDKDEHHQKDFPQPKRRASDLAPPSLPVVVGSCVVNKGDDESSSCLLESGDGVATSAKEEVMGHPPHTTVTVESGTSTTSSSSSSSSISPAAKFSAAMTTGYKALFGAMFSSGATGSASSAEGAASEDHVTAQEDDVHVDEKEPKPRSSDSSNSSKGAQEPMSSSTTLEQDGGEDEDNFTSTSGVPSSSEMKSETRTENDGNAAPRPPPGEQARAPGNIPPAPKTRTSNGPRPPPTPGLAISCSPMEEVLVDGSHLQELNAIPALNSTTISDSARSSALSAASSSTHTRDPSPSKISQQLSGYLHKLPVSAAKTMNSPEVVSKQARDSLNSNLSGLSPDKELQELHLQNQEPLKSARQTPMHVKEQLKGLLINPKNRSSKNSVVNSQSNSKETTPREVETTTSSKNVDPGVEAAAADVKKGVERTLFATAVAGPGVTIAPGSGGTGARTAGGAPAESQHLYINAEQQSVSSLASSAMSLSRPGSDRETSSLQTGGAVVQQLGRGAPPREEDSSPVDVDPPDVAGTVDHEDDDFGIPKQAGFSASSPLAEDLDHDHVLMSARRAIARSEEIETRRKAEEQGDAEAALGQLKEVAKVEFNH